MSEYQQVLEEKAKLDSYMVRQFKFIHIEENLSGATVTLQHPGGEAATVQLLTAEARKYLTNLLIKQLAQARASAAAASSSSGAAPSA
ncbi:hypothetical protein [Paenibacillus sp. Leaf72]|uniref:hypothetical protein n=1 Tax=Paenibacillus sp. Leaf72 TaxID=1736234 RepID=UPI0006F4813E|nr:hypothetical protein [Paenibacillus sp. Leaf72]KQO18325.1 hypothetical protein ASF12_06805 [Paenibacillus sp. Leaf72]